MSLDASLVAGSFISWRTGLWALVQQRAAELRVADVRLCIVRIWTRQRVVATGAFRAPADTNCGESSNFACCCKVSDVALLLGLKTRAQHLRLRRRQAQVFAGASTCVLATWAFSILPHTDFALASTSAADSQLGSVDE